MNNLKAIQERMQRAILENDTAVIDDICENEKEQRNTLLGVYQHAYGARLIEFLENEFPILHAWMGDDEFSKLARDYYQTHPSDHPNARQFGRHFAKLTSSHEGLKNNPECGELAQLEHALNQAFDAQDRAPLTMADLETLEPDQWATLTFKPHPSTSRLTFKTNASQIWNAIHKQKEAPAAKMLGIVEQLIIWRGDEMARFRQMQDDEVMIWDAAMKGASFGELCTLLGTYWPEDEAPMKAAGYLTNWLSSEFLVKPHTA